MAFISGEQRNDGLKLRGTGELRQFWRTGNIENEDFDFREQENKMIYLRVTREQVLPRRASFLFLTLM